MALRLLLRVAMLTTRFSTRLSLLLVAIVASATACEVGERSSSLPTADEPVLAGYVDGDAVNVAGLHELVADGEHVNLIHGDQVYPLELGGLFEDESGNSLEADSAAFVDDQSVIDRFAARELGFDLVAIDDDSGTSRRIGRVEHESGILDVQRARRRPRCATHPDYPWTYDLPAGCCLDTRKRRQSFRCYNTRLGARFRAGTPYCVRGTEGSCQP